MAWKTLQSGAILGKTMKDVKGARTYLHHTQNGGGAVRDSDVGIPDIRKVSSALGVLLSENRYFPIRIHNINW